MPYGITQHAPSIHAQGVSLLSFCLSSPEVDGHIGHQEAGEGEEEEQHKGEDLR